MLKARMRSLSPCNRRDISSHSLRWAEDKPGLSLNITTWRITPVSFGVAILMALMALLLTQELRDLAVHDDV
jgi:uncharacterized membrane protein